MSAPQLPRPTVPAVQQIGGVVLVSGQGIRDLRYALSCAIKAAPRERQERHLPRLMAFHALAIEAFELQNRLAQLGESARGLSEVRAAPAVGKLHQDERDWIDTAEAAELGQCTERHCRRLAREVFAHDGRARKAGGSWVIDRNAFIDYRIGRTE